MREKLKNELLLMLDKYIDDDSKLKSISQNIDSVLSNYDIQNTVNEIITYEYAVPKTVKIYIVSKKIAGISERSLYLYNIVLNDFFITVQKPDNQITANDIRVYLYKYQEEHGITNRTLDSKRIIICTYFTWLTSEGYISKNPALNISPIKYEQKHKKAMTQLELEQIRLVCKTKREKAIVEMLYSTEARVSELEHLNISDVNFQTKEVILFGKENKHRTSYLNAKAEVALKDYLSDREDDNESLFVHDRNPHNRLKKSGIELIIKNIAKRTNLNINVTPHLFRHGFASDLINREMDIIDVSHLLGHKSIKISMIYVTHSDTLVKNNFLKFSM